MKKTLLLWLFGLLLTAQVYAQNRSLSGTVKDDKGEALIGVNVTGKGTTIGTVTDIDGKYTLELPKDVKSLVFSYVGFTNLEKSILSLAVNAVMVSDAAVIEELVVTAMAIKREARSITGSFNTVTNDEFNQGSSNAIGAIQAKVPGLRINTVGGQVGASTRIILRGEASITGNNNALIVVDGIPIVNSVNSFGANSGDFVDFGNRANDINPDDIESITVLKGPAATALYGSRATAGVILYTTKSGKSKKNQEKKFNISASTGITFDKVYLLFKRQNQFGQGYDNKPDAIENFSWGPAFDGVVRPWTPAISTPNGTSQLIRAYSPVKNQLEDAFDIGTTLTSNLSLDGGNDKFTYFVSYGNIRNKGIFPNSFYKRNTISANASAKLGEKVTTKFNITYSNINQRTIQGQGNGGGYVGPYQILIQQPVNIPLNELRDYNSPYHDFNGYYGGYTPNPYWVMDNTNNDNKTDNLLGSVEVEFKPVEYISLLARVGTNYITSNSFISRPKYNYVRSGPNPVGSDLYAEDVERRNDLTADIIATFNKSLGKKKNFNLSVLGGYNYYQRGINTLETSTQGGLVVPAFYSLSNSVGQSTSSNTIDQYKLIGLYGNVNLGYKNMIFLEYSARNDWSSTLPEGKRGFFYQAGGLSFVPTELIKNSSKAKDWISYVKIRANVGTQGKDAGTYDLQSIYQSNPTLSTTGLGVQFPFGGINGYTRGDQIGNPGLKPELTFLWEAGVDLDLFKDYLHVEYTYYERRSKDLIVQVSLPPSAGYRFQVKNIGEMSNKGHELLARVSILKNIKNINWNVRVQYANNVNNVVKVSDESPELNLNTGSIQVVAKEGLPYGTFKAFDYLRDPQGNIVVDATGAPSASTQFSYFGSYQPKYTLGAGSTLSWKGLTFDIQFDIRKGGQFYAGTKEAGEWNGTTLSSLENNRQPYIIPGSVVSNNDGTYSPNTTPVTDVFFAVGNIANDITSRNLIDASFVKLREASLSYTFDKKFFKNVPISSITISAIGRNLKFWLPKENTYADPETNSFGYAGNIQGLEFGSVPNTRSYGFDVKFKF